MNPNKFYLFQYFIGVKHFVDLCGIGEHMEACKKVLLSEKLSSNLNMESYFIPVRDTDEVKLEILEFDLVGTEPMRSSTHNVKLSSISECTKNKILDLLLEDSERESNDQ